MDKLVYNPTAVINAQAEVRQSMVQDFANVSTIGFKRSLDLALRTVKVSGAGFDTRYQAQVVARNEVPLDPGPVMVTGRNLDIAMDKSAVLGVQAPNGELAFTRRGDLRVNTSGVLENGSGHPVRGQNGPINVPPGSSVRITPEGQVVVRDPTQPGPGVEQVLDQLLLRDAQGVIMSRREDGLFAVSGQPPGSDFKSGPTLPTIVPQALEGSNVNPVEAMARLLDQSRTFEAQIRVVKEMKDLDTSGAAMMKQG